ncbi:putative sodium-dependent multivitamin transporter [Dermacentor silvarum]|uniref:putative sodium-dependent multivitamin transporter n=1 Tax=Dermacentor silvarum TaxID=543639 RepID=UPI001899365A|nr:putative sodium-dependent multivitamin transporter [Dermacentor silvarum]
MHSLAVLCARSTLSSGFNALAAVTWEDFLVCHLSLTSRQEAYITKLVAALYGLLTIGLAFVAGTVGSILKAAFAMSGALSGPLLGVFTMGLLFPVSNKKGALAGLLLGEAMCLWVVGGSLRYGSPSEDLATFRRRVRNRATSSRRCNFNVSRHPSPVEPE